MAAIVKQLVAFASAEARRICCPTPLVVTANSGVASGDALKDWFEVLVRHPKLYLRVTLSLDISMAKGCVPRSSDLPKRLLLADSEGSTTAGKYGHLLDDIPQSPSAFSMFLKERQVGASLTSLMRRSPAVNLDFLEIKEMIEDEQGEEKVDEIEADDMVTWLLD